jgi:hypothetical protein
MSSYAERPSTADIKSTLQLAGKDIRKAAKRRFENPQATVDAVRALMETPEVLEAWANECLQSEPGVVVLFRFADLPTPLQRGAMESLAVAYLAAGKPVPEKNGEEVRVEFG